MTMKVDTTLGKKSLAALRNVAEESLTSAT